MKARKTKGESHFDSGGNGNGGAWPGAGGGAQTTGRFLVLFRENAAKEGLEALRQKTGVQATSAKDLASGGGPGDRAAADADAIHFEHLGVAVVKGDPDQYRAMASAASADEDGAVLAVEPERVVFAIAGMADDPGAAAATLPETSRHEQLGLPPAVRDELMQPAAPIVVPPAPPLLMPAGTPATRRAITADYLHGYRDAIDSLLRHLGDGRRAAGREGASDEEAAAAAAIDESQATWGLQFTHVLRTRYSGKNVRVAVLDTGFDLQHPDFVGRQIVAQSFVPGQTPQDGHLHGTHCIGTSTGPQKPPILPRYGIAYRSAIYVGKVLSNAGSGQDGWILAGINWAIENKCKVVSMSLGAPVQPGQSFSQVYEQVAQRALRAGTLIVAAAGNESNRPAGIFAPVGHPANCPSIMAVGAIDQNLQIAPFSCRGINPVGGKVDVAGPGVNVYSTSPMPTRYRRLSGTSMATPHVAGIAALWAEARPNATAQGLWQLLVSHAKPLAIPSVDVGAGLVQAP